MDHCGLIHGLGGVDGGGVVHGLHVAVHGGGGVAVGAGVDYGGGVVDGVGDMSTVTGDRDSGVSLSLGPGGERHRS